MITANYIAFKLDPPSIRDQPAEPVDDYREI